MHWASKLMIESSWCRSNLANQGCEQPHVQLGPNHTVKRSRTPPKLTPTIHHIYSKKSYKLDLYIFWRLWGSALWMASQQRIARDWDMNGRFLLFLLQVAWQPNTNCPSMLLPIYCWNILKHQPYQTMRNHALYLATFSKSNAWHAD